MNSSLSCRFAVAVVALGFCTGLVAQTTVPQVIHSQTVQRVVQTQADVEALARGYEQAYRLISNQTVYITYKRDDVGFVTVAGIKDVRAAGGVITITRARDVSVIVSANAVVAISTEQPPSFVP